MTDIRFPIVAGNSVFATTYVHFLQVYPVTYPLLAADSSEGIKAAAWNRSL